MTETNIYQKNLNQKIANFTPLSPLSFIERTAYTYPTHLSIIHGRKKFTWEKTYYRCKRFASALKKNGITAGDTVAIMGANTPEMYEATFSVPMAGGVLNALNVRLDSHMIAFCLSHGEAKILITDIEFSETIRDAISILNRDILVIDINDSEANVNGALLGLTDYESFLMSGDENFEWLLPNDEWDAISLNYTSGTTGDPKGVVYHHRGAYLNALSHTINWNMHHHPVYLWTLPMFHCNGWCFPWTIASIGGTNICLRQVTAKNIYQSIKKYQVTHFCGAPIVMSLITNASDQERCEIHHEINVMTAASPPPAATLQKMKELGFHVTHVYGLTETYGPAVVCAWQHSWNNLPLKQQAEKTALQGVKYQVLEDLTVMNPKTMRPVPHDGKTIGEVMFKGNIVMKGYLKNPKTTNDSLSGGWFHSGDLGVIETNGYINLKDRSKDIIISGGENISSIEIENILHAHPSVFLAAVVAKKDEKWGETPCAFIELKSKNDTISEQEIINFCRLNLAHFKVPKKIIFGILPKTSTGKIQKFKLREQL